MKSHIFAPALALLAVAPASPGSVSERPSRPDAVETGVPAPAEESGPLSFSVDGGGLTWSIPRGELLVYEVEVDIGILGSPQVGELALECGVKPYATPVLVEPGSATPSDSAGLETGWARATASGEHMLYSLHELIETSFLPQEWPRLLYRTTQSGSESRRRDLKIGVQDGAPIAWYRSDRHCKGCTNREHYLKPNWAWQDERHCKKCKRGEHRVWRDPQTRAVGPRAVDMLSAVLIARSMIERGEERVAFQVIDKTDLWDISIRRGSPRVLEVPAGKFRAVPLMLDTRLPAGEPEVDEAFSALFGLHGSIQIWVEESSGVPILIAGDVPAGPMDLGVRASLKRAVGAELARVRE